jgi:hypothetical protein
MNNCLNDFNIRKKEVDEYCNFLEFLEKGDKVRIFHKNKRKDEKNLKITDLQKTLKANLMLLLYNLVESTVRNLLIQIYDELKTKKIDFDILIPTFRKKIIKQLEECNIEELEKGFVMISNDIVTIPFHLNQDKILQKMISGNVDAKKIRELGKTFGFSTPTHSQNIHGEDLLKIKNYRNELAHGSQSFNDIGKNLTVPEIIEIKKRTFSYLEQLIKNIETYLQGQKYKK